VDVHDLTAAYAVDALDADERERYEAHLASCDRCREELASFAPAVAALPYAVDAPPPPSALRERILDAARSDNVVPLRRRRWPVVASAVSVAAAAAAIAWAVTLSRSLSDARAERDAAAAAARVLASPASTHRLAGASGVVSVDRTGRGVLVFNRLATAPSGKTYEAWVIPNGSQPIAAGTFDGGAPVVVVPLGANVPRGSIVAVTVERAGGVAHSTQKPIVTATT
jgi:anti-sigma-K factor RskA